MQSHFTDLCVFQVVSRRPAVVQHCCKWWVRSSIIVKSQVFEYDGDIASDYVLREVCDSVLIELVYMLRHLSSVIIGVQNHISIVLPIKSETLPVRDSSILYATFEDCRVRDGGVNITHESRIARWD